MRDETRYYGLFKVVACITVKGKVFRHQTIFTGVGDEVHCHFCGLKFQSSREAQDAFEFERQLEMTKWPEGAEL